MTLTQEHLDFEKFSRQLIGLKVLKVEYSEIVYEQANPKPYYPTQFANLDTVDFSIFLHCDNEILVEIYWDVQFFQYGIGIKINEPSDFSGNIKWNGSDNELWKIFIDAIFIVIGGCGVSVSCRVVIWGKTEYYTYPQDIKLTFSNDKNIFISAAGFLNQNDKEVCGMLDNLTVTDNEELARQVKMIN